MPLEKKEMQQITDIIDDLGEGLGKKLEKSTADINQNVDVKLQKSANEINENVDKKVKEAETSLQDEISKAKGISQKALEIAEDLKKKQNTGGMNGGVNGKNFGSELLEKLTEKEAQLKEFKVNKKGFGSIDLQAKAVGTMASATSLTGSYFVSPNVVPGIEIKPYEQIHMRNLLPVGTTNSNAVRYVRDNGGEGGPTVVAEGAAKPQIDRDLQIYDANVRKIATYFRVPEEMIDDIPYLTSFLSQIGIEEVMIVEDAQILYGDGTGQNLSGLFTNATAFAAGTSVIGASANNFDVLMAARKQARVAKFNPSIALLSPVDFYDLTQKKDTTNNYLFLGGGNGIDAQSVISTRGLRIIEHTAVTAGDFLVFDPMKAAIFDRSGTSVRFYDQDQDNAIKNLITIVIEKRLALPIYQPGAFIKGTFSTAITDLTS